MSEVLELPSFRAAQVEILTGDPAEELVRWVHSSEVYEMGSLLAGGEILLTSGLGLHGRTGEQLAAYVDQICDAGCVGLAVEMGRSFFAMPDVMIQAARSRELVLMSLDSVVPFERMVEDFHDLLVRRKIHATRQTQPLLRDLLAIALTGAGLRTVLDEICRSAGCAVELLDSSGQLIERSRIRSVSSDDELSASVQLDGAALGSLVLRARASTRLRTVADAGAMVVSVVLSRHRGMGSQPSQSNALVGDLTSGAARSHGEVQRRLLEVGWSSAAVDSAVLAVAIDGDRRVPLADLVGFAATAFSEVSGISAITGVIGSDVVVLTRGVGNRQRLRKFLREAADRLSELSGSTQLVGAAEPVEDLAELADAMRHARAVLRSARRTGMHHGVLISRDVGIHRLLHHLEGGVLNDFVSEQIGPLISEDREHSADLVRTLDAYLSSGYSKADTARALGIRRQSLYARLSRIESILGVALEDSTQTAGLTVALIGWRMRTGLDPQAVFERRPARPLASRNPVRQDERPSGG